MDFSTMEIAALEERLAEIKAEATEERTLDELNAFKSEKEAIEAEIENRKADEAERRKAAAEIAESLTAPVIAETKTEVRQMENIEIRNTNAYIDAYVNYIKTNDDTDRLILQMKLINENVYNYFGVNEDILQNKAIGDAWSAFYEGAIEPFAIQFSDVVTKMLFSQREREIGAKVVATANRLQYMSNTDKLNVSAQMADRGLMTRNEIREIWNLAPLPDEIGDTLPVRGEYYNLTEEATE